MSDIVQKWLEKVHSDSEKNPFTDDEKNRYTIKKTAFKTPGDYMIMIWSLRMVLH